MPQSANAPESAVISLVLHLSEDTALRTAALAALRSLPGLELGAEQERWLPVVAETPAPQELHRQIEAIPGVEYVDVTFVEVVPPAAAPSQA